ncbi:MAG: acetyl-CoA carboxylase, biotin carboxyl carrier protein [Clostridia bacterium]|nr:acetyl-CoA carboxylase, biotin carboxyl carrier protein [Clostridia bacterium]
MKEADIRKYAALMKELELTGLEITEDNKVVRLERTQPGIAREPVIVQTNSVPVTTLSETVKNDSNDGCISVKSSFVGVFYAAPAENAEPFVSPGDRVEKGQTLCIIEAMKLMNEISAEESGVVEKICVTNGQVVEYGTELFRIRR